MSLAATLRPTNLPFASTISGNGPATHHNPASTPTDTSFHLDSKYLALSRMLFRFQHLILLTPPPGAPPLTQTYELSHLQRQIQAELWSPLPYHRTKWLHNIDGARNLLLQLERGAVAIKVQRAKKEAVQDLAEKRKLIKRLRSRVEEIGREIEDLGERAWEMQRAADDELLGERADVVVARLRGSKEVQGGDTGSEFIVGSNNDTLQEGTPVTTVEAEDREAIPSAGHAQRDSLFGDSSLRQRNNGSQDAPSPHHPSTTSGFSHLARTENSLSAQSTVHESLTSSLLNMATQLKQQTRAFQGTLLQDSTLLDRAIQGLDTNVSGMELASRNVAFLTRMSEGEGWWGRIKLYAFIVGMWVAAVLLVFVGPKLRF